MCECEKEGTPLTVEEQAALLAKALKENADRYVFDQWIDVIKREGYRRIAEGKSYLASVFWYDDYEEHEKETGKDNVDSQG